VAHRVAIRELARVEQKPYRDRADAIEEKINQFAVDIDVYLWKPGTFIAFFHPSLSRPSPLQSLIFLYINSTKSSDAKHGRDHQQRKGNTRRRYHRPAKRQHDGHKYNPIGDRYLESHARKQGNNPVGYKHGGGSGI
jgi:hypothetical protein